MDVWVIAETSAGRVKPPVFELVSEAARLVSVSGGRTVAVLLDPEAPADGLIEHGAHQVRRVKGFDWDGADIGVPSSAVAALIAEHDPTLVLVAGTVFGRDLAPRVAVRLGIGLVEDCSYLRIGADGIVHATRMEADGAAAVRLTWKPGNTALAMVPPGTFRADASLAHPGAEQLEVACPDVAEPAFTLEHLRPIDPAELPLEDVAVIVAGGLGMGSPEGFDLLAELARAVGGKVGASRRATDLGWAGREALVGQTGKTVEPALYLACGISGASQHVLGMKDSGYIVSINNDPFAPMHAIADLAVTADALKLVPRLTAEFVRSESREVAS